MVKSNVKAFIRTRPTASSFDGLKVHPDGVSVSIKLPKVEEAGLINNKQDAFSFKFDGVLENASQEAVYNAAASEVVDSVLAGYSGCVFAYGQTGAGKTFTMAGDLNNYTHRGIIPRSVHHVFQEIDRRVDKLYQVQVSYLEIYNEQLYDLLAENPGSSEGLAVMEDAVLGSHVRGLSLVTVRSEEEALSAFFTGEQGRSTARHVLNSSSTRSHCVFTLHLTIRTSEAASERALLARLHLVDLAGSERTKKTNATGQTLKEAQFINKSLSFLEQTVNALVRHEPHVSFRQTRLTSVLKDALGGNCKTVMLANIWGEPAHVDETLSTLRFASRVRQLTSNLSLAESTDTNLLLRRYERQVRELKQELAMRDALSGRTRVNYDDLSEADLQELQRLVRRYFKGEAELEELPTDSLKRIRETYKAMKAAAASAQEEYDIALSAAKAGAASTATAAQPGSGVGQQQAEGVGAVDADSRGFQAGVAPAHLRPAKPAGLPGTQQSRSSAGGALNSLPSDTSFGSLGADGAADLDAPGTSDVARRNAAFRHFKRVDDQGIQLSAAVKELGAELRAARTAVKEVAEHVNASKAGIDELSAVVAAGAKLQAAADVLDAEYHRQVQELKQAKAAYRQAFDELKARRSALEALVEQQADAKQALVAAFEAWLASPAAATAAATPPQGGDEDELDAGEAFERMQLQTASAQDPNSVAYKAALRKTGGARTMRPAGLFGGSKALADATRKKEHLALINAGLVR